MEEGETRSLPAAPRQPNRVKHEQQLVELAEKISRSVEA